MERHKMAKWETPEDFIKATIGRRYDLDGWPTDQRFQCWDYGDYFWVNQVGRSLITKFGGMASVRDCWNVSRKVNAGNDFELITDKTKLKKGDWVIFNAGGDGHIGIVKSVVKPGVSVMLQGENQGSTYVNVINRSLSDFLGAFRLKAWHKTEQKPNVAEGLPKSIKIGDKVKTSLSHDVFGVKLNLQIINDGQSVLKKLDNNGKHAWLYKGKILRCIVKSYSLKKI